MGAGERPNTGLGCHLTPGAPCTDPWDSAVDNAESRWIKTPGLWVTLWIHRLLRFLCAKGLCGLCEAV